MKILKTISVLIIALVPSFVGALEVGFPEVGGYSPDETSGPAEWIRYVYLLSMGLVGLALIYTFARAGIERMSGGMNPGAISSANKRIKDGMIGLLILLGSYLFLKEINPALVTLNSPKIEASEMKSPFDFFLELYFKSNSPNSNEEPARPESHETDCGGVRTCGAGLYCLDRDGDTINPALAFSVGKCMSQKPNRETCDPQKTGECYGRCDPATSKCVRR